MASIRVRPETGHLYFDFRYLGLRCREQAALEDSPENRKRMQQVLCKIEVEIKNGTFDYGRQFPSSKMLTQIRQLAPAPGTGNVVTTAAHHPLPAKPGVFPTIAEFAEVWYAEVSISWRQATKDLNRFLLDRYVVRHCGLRRINDFKRADVLAFRAVVATPSPDETRKEPRSASTVNHIMGVLHMLMYEAAQRYEFPDPTAGIKRLKLKKTDVHPFSMEEVKTIISNVRPDYRNYYVVRFFTAMRTGEMHGLKWRHVDFQRRQILVRETHGKGRTEYTKNDGSQREIDMSTAVYDALKAQQLATGEVSEYVFCGQDGQALDEKNVADRVWYPLLRLLGLRRRRPYEARHTCATLWLAAGENPEWIAPNGPYVDRDVVSCVFPFRPQPDQEGRQCFRSHGQRIHQREPGCGK